MEHAIAELDAGRARVAEKIDGQWVTRQWLKKAVLLSFRLRDNRIIASPSAATPGGPRLPQFYDKVPTKFEDYTEADFAAGGYRVVPAAVVRRGAFIASNVVLMPSFVNIGAYVDEATMVDTWVTVGSCAQMGRTCTVRRRRHRRRARAAAGQSTIIEDNCFIGARSGWWKA